MSQLLAHLLVKTRHVIEDIPVKTGEYPNYIPQFSRTREGVSKTYSNGVNKHNSLNLRL